MEERLQPENLEKRGNCSNQLEWLNERMKGALYFGTNGKGEMKSVWAPNVFFPSIYQNRGSRWIGKVDPTTVNRVLTYKVRTVPT